jgi:restriction system protein
MPPHTPSIPSIQDIRYCILKYLKTNQRHLRREDVKTGAFKLVTFVDPGWFVMSGNNKPRWSERMGWEMDWLKKRGYIDNPKRGFWVITQAGSLISSSSQLY